MLSGITRSSAFLAGEATAVATVQSQLYNPGVLPTGEDFALALAMMGGFESLTMARSAMRRMKIENEAIFKESRRATEVRRDLNA